MNILDNLSKIKKIDQSNMLDSIQQLSLQLKQTKKELAGLKIPSSYSKVQSIVVNGMGGSRLGARVAQRLFEDKLKIPIYPIGNYDLPEFVDDKTLLIISSYSGNTEEPLNTIKEAFNRKAKILVFAQNGKLAKIAKEENLPGYYDFIPRHNPCNQPRMSLGYQILAVMIMLSKCNLIKISPQEINELISFLEKTKKKLNVDIKTSKNPAKKLAQKFHSKIPVLVAAEFLMGALRVWRNQTNENAKQMAVLFEIPELNHHLLEGMGYPKTNPNNLFFIFTKSRFYHPRNQKRIEITKKVLDGYKIKHGEVSLSGKNKLEQAFELIQFGGFVGFYLSMLNNLDPSPIPWVDYFKEQLASA